MGAIIRTSVFVSLFLWGIGLMSTPIVRGACYEIATFADNLDPDRYLHVSVNGSDETGDGSPGSPYATLSHAVGQATPGTAVVVHSGVYPGGIYLEGVYGSSTAPIWIGGAVAESRPIIDGGNEGIHISRASFVVLHDLEIRNTAYNGINVDDGGEVSNPLATHHILFERLDIHDIGGSGNQDGLKLSGVRDFVVRRCEIRRCGGGMSGSGIDMVGCHRGVIADSKLNDISGNGVQAKGGSKDIDIRWNHFKNAGQRSVNIGGSTGFQYFRPPLSETEPNFEARQIQVLSNVFEGSSTPAAFVGCIDSVFANNTLIDPQIWIVRILQETTSYGDYVFLPCGGNRFENNLAYFDSGQIRRHVNIGPDTDSSSFLFSNNLWYAHDNPSNSEPDLPAPESEGIYGENPKMKDPAADNYRIGPDSPAAGSGNSPVLLQADIAGRCYRQPPSVGAYEYLEPCGGDTEPDGDVDGWDVWIWMTATVQPAPDLPNVTPDFGRIDCY